LILQALPSDAPLYNIKPGIYLAYALIQSVFGQTDRGIRLGLLVVNTAAILVLFALAKRFFGLLVAVAAAAVFAILALQQSVLGFSANREHFVLLPALAGILLLLRAIDCRKNSSLLAGALLLGISFVMKPNGLIFIAFAGLYLLFCEIRRRPFKWKLFLASGVIFALGAVLPLALICLLLWRLGLLKIFWFWRIVYTPRYASVLPLSMGLELLSMRIVPIVASAVLIWILSAVGLAALFSNKKDRPHAVFVVGFLIFSFLAVCPGLYFRPHYFILLLPAVALLAGSGLGFITRRFAPVAPAPLAKFVPAVLLSIVILQAVYKQRAFLFQMSPAEVSRQTYFGNPFLQSLEIAHFINENSTPDDRIVVLGSEPQIYFYSKRHSATGHMYMYPLMGKYDFALEMQHQLIREIETARPKFIVFAGISTSWLVQPDSHRTIFDWFHRYQQTYYKQVGVVEIVSDRRTIYRWNEDAAGYVPRSQFWLLVFQRENLFWPL